MKDYNKYLDQIERNRLYTLDYDFLIGQLCVLNNKPFVDMKAVVDALINTGRLNVQGSEDVLNEKKKTHDNRRKSSSNDNVQMAYNMLSKKDSRRKKVIKRFKGQIDKAAGGYAFLLPDDADMADIFIPERELKGAFNKDRVIVETVPSNRKKLEGKVIQVLERGQQRIVGKIFITKNHAYVTPDDVKFGADISVPLNDLKGANNGDKVVVNIERYFANNRRPEGRVIEVLGEPDKIEVEVLSIVRANNLYETFPDNVLQKSKDMPTELDINLYKHRKDLRKEICFTIDGEDSRDLDDAIGFKINEQGNRVLSVHIADVGEYVPLNSVIDKEAFSRGTSIYFPNLVLPMLPRELSNGICSLNEGQDRLALTIEMECDDAGNIIDYNFFESIIKSKKRFTYTIVQGIFDGDKEIIKENKAYVGALLAMNKLAKQFAKKRENLGSLRLNIPEVQVFLDELGGVALLEKRPSNDSHKLIESFMVAANECVATFFANKKLPFVYRVHEKPSPEKMDIFLTFVKAMGVVTKAKNENISPKELQLILDQVVGKESEYAVNKITLRSLQKAKYSPTCLGHFGLALEYYCHFTSPIRRYPDLTIHRIIKDYLKGKLNIVDTKSFVLASSLNSSEREVEGEKIERDVDDLYKAYYMKDKIGNEYDGIISGVTKFGCYVQLDNTVEGFIRLIDLPMDDYEYIEEKLVLKGVSNTFAIGKKLKIKVDSVNISARKIDFVLA